MKHTCSVVTVDADENVVSSCDNTTEETWDYQDIVDSVNEGWIKEGLPLRMTDAAICQAHMDQVKEEDV